MRPQDPAEARTRIPRRRLIIGVFLAAAIVVSIGYLVYRGMTPRMVPDEFTIVSEVPAPAIVVIQARVDAPESANALLPTGTTNDNHAPNDPIEIAIRLRSAIDSRDSEAFGQQLMMLACLGDASVPVINALLGESQGTANVKFAQARNISDASAVETSTCRAGLFWALRKIGTSMARDAAVEGVQESDELLELYEVGRFLHERGEFSEYQAHLVSGAIVAVVRLSELSSAALAGEEQGWNAPVDLYGYEIAIVRHLDATSTVVDYLGDCVRMPGAHSAGWLALMAEELPSRDALLELDQVISMRNRQAMAASDCYQAMGMLFASEPTAVARAFEFAEDEDKLALLDGVRVKLGMMANPVHIPNPWQDPSRQSGGVRASRKDAENSLQLLGVCLASCQSSACEEVVKAAVLEIEEWLNQGAFP